MSKGPYTEQRKAAEISKWIGHRVEMHPTTDAWMMGDRYGEIAKLGSKYAHVKMDRSGRTRRVAYDNLIYVS